MNLRALALIIFDLLLFLAIIKYVGLQKMGVFSLGWMLGILVSGYFFISRASPKLIKKWKTEYTKRYGVLNHYKLVPPILLLITALFSLKQFSLWIALFCGAITAIISCYYLIHDCGETMHALMLFTETFQKLLNKRGKKKR